MSYPSPSPLTPADPTAPHPRASQYATIRYRASLGLLLACPIVLALPPRNLNAYSFGLGLVWLYSLDEVLSQHRQRLPIFRPPAVDTSKEPNETEGVPQILMQMRREQEGREGSGREEGYVEMGRGEAVDETRK